MSYRITHIHKVTGNDKPSLSSVKTSTSPLLPAPALQKIFNRAAKTYNHGSALAKEVANRLIECLDIMRISPNTILDLGSGTGYTSELLAKRYPGSQCIALDFAQQMLLQMPANNQVHAICAAAEKLPLAPASIDLIVSNLMLPWCFDLPTVFNQIHDILKPGGLLRFSTLGPDSLTELVSSFATADEYPHVHPSYDLHDIGDALMHVGFCDPVINKETVVVSYKNLNAFFNDMKFTGGYNVLSQRRNTLTGKTRWQQFLGKYELFRDDTNRIPASFEIVYGHAWRGPLPSS